MENLGYIYILTNPSFKDTFLKIGKTKRTPQERAEELSRATGVAMPFKVEHSRKFIDCNIAETLVHDALKEYRSSSIKEFFEAPIHIAIQVIDNLAIQDLQQQLDSLQSKTKPQDILTFEIINNWHNFFISIGWSFTKTPAFEYNYAIKPEFIIDTIFVETDTPFGIEKSNKKLLVFIVPDLPTQRTDEPFKNDTVLKIETLYRSDDKEDNNQVLILSKSLIDGEYIGWISCYGGWELARFTFLGEKAIIKYGLLNDERSWKCIITGQPLQKENIYFNEADIKNLWTKVESEKKAIPLTLGFASAGGDE